MIVLDTNVLSAMMRVDREPQVRAWIDAQRPDDIWITAISILEIRSGILRLPQGRRRSGMGESFDRLLQDVVPGRVLFFDAEAAERAAVLATRRIAAGLNIETLDTQIAGICLSRRATLATRNLRHFRDLDLDLVDPWSA